ncbi:unnamed protein product, partial [Onchocerca ochengi]
GRDGMFENFVECSGQFYHILYLEYIRAMVSGNFNLEISIFRRFYSFERRHKW